MELSRTCHVAVQYRSQRTYRQIPAAAQGCSLGSWEGKDELRGLRRQEPLLKLSSWDSGVEMVVEDSPQATLLGLSQVPSLDFEPIGICEPLTIAAKECPAHLGQLLAESWSRC